MNVIKGCGITFKLSYYINKNMIFQFIPGFSNGKIGGKILYNSQITIFNTKFKSFIELDFNKGKSF
jgi:hypothetical protein